MEPHLQLRVQWNLVLGSSLPYLLISRFLVLPTRLTVRSGSLGYPALAYLSSRQVFTNEKTQYALQLYQQLLMLDSISFLSSHQDQKQFHTQCVARSSTALMSWHWHMPQR